MSLFVIIAIWYPVLRAKDDGMSDIEIADRLARDVASLRGLRPRSLQASGQVAYGTLMFRYLADKTCLMVAILVSDDDLWDKLGDTFKENYLRSIKAHSDAAIGGLFDAGGGAWLFEPATGKTFLYRNYPLNSNSGTVNDGLERMSYVVPAWETRWSNAVSNIALGKAPPPSHFVTLDNDPYADNL